MGAREFQEVHFHSKSFFSSLKDQSVIIFVNLKISLNFLTFHGFFDFEKSIKNSIKFQRNVHPLLYFNHFFCSLFLFVSIFSFTRVFIFTSMKATREYFASEKRIFFIAFEYSPRYRLKKMKMRKKTTRSMVRWELNKLCIIFLSSPSLFVVYEYIREIYKLNFTCGR